MATLQSLNFNPTSIANCALWLDARDSSTVILSGNTVTQWNDKSGNGRNATLFNSNSPTYSSNGMNFAGTQAFSTSLTASSTTESGFVVCKFTNFSANSTLLGCINGQGGRQFRVGSNAVIETIKQDIVGVVYTGSALSANTSYLLEFVNNGTTLTHYSNASTYASGSSIAYTAGLTTGIGGRLQAGGGLQEALTGVINEIIVFSVEVSTSQRQQVEGYLAWKWGLQASLPTTHPYYNIAPNSANLPYPSRIPVQIQAFLPVNLPIVLFNPKTVSGIQLWLDASDPNGTGALPSNGASISTWVDKSGVGNNATQGTSSNQPSYSNSALTFSGGQSLLTPLNFIMNSQSFFFVGKFSGTVVPQNDIIGPYTNVVGGSNNGIQTIITNSNTQRMTTFGATFTMNGGTVSTNTTFLYEYTYSGGGTSYMFLNASQTASLISSPSFTSQASQVLVGAYKDSGGYGEYYNGSMNELLLFNTVVSTTQRQQIEGYLAWKWSFVSSLPSNHPYKYNPPGLVVPLPTISMQGTSFSPARVSGIALWLDGQDPLGTGTAPTTGASVATWYDKSGNGKNGTGTAATYLSGGGLAFNGTNTYYSNTSMTYDLSKRSMFVVVKVNSYTQYAGIVPMIPTPTSGSDTAATSGLSVEMGNAFIRYYGNGGGYFADIANASYTSISMYNDNMNGTQGSQFLNGNQVALPTANYTATSSSGYVVGARWQGGVLSSPYANANFYEVLLFTGPLTTLQRQSVEGYLAWKWGLQGSLPSNHPFKKFQPPPN